jgi:hypothetical protein
LQHLGVVIDFRPHAITVRLDRSDVPRLVTSRLRRLDFDRARHSTAPPIPTSISVGRRG